MFGGFAFRRLLAAFQRRRQRGDALLEARERIALAFDAAELIDLGRQHAHIVAEPHQRVIGRDVGNDGAKCGDGALELADRRGIIAGTQDHVELGAEIADRVIVAGKLLRRGQRAQHFANLAQGALDAGQRLAIDAALAGVVDAPRQRLDFAFDRFDRLAWHRFGNGVANLGQFAAESGDRLLDPIGSLQRFDLARDLEQMALERRKIRTSRHRGRRHRGCDRGGAGRRHRPWRGLIKFVLARSDFRDGDVERRRADGRRGAIDLGGGAFDHVGLALLVLRPGRFCRGGV